MKLNFFESFGGQCTDWFNYQRINGFKIGAAGSEAHRPNPTCWEPVGCKVYGSRSNLVESRWQTHKYKIVQTKNVVWAVNGPCGATAALASSTLIHSWTFDRAICCTVMSAALLVTDGVVRTMYWLESREFSQTHRYKASRAAASLQIANGFLVVTPCLASSSWKDRAASEL